MLLAVDLGKTSCRAVVHGNPEGAVAVEGAPGLAAPGGVRAAERAILAAADALGLDGVDEVVVGAAGALAAPDAARELGEALARSLPAARVAVTSDAVLAHAGALGGEPGVVLIAGTGVVALAIDADGGLRVADGWGPWLGDEGGGAWIGASGLRAALRAHDGRGPSTALLAAARERFGDPSGWPAFAHDARALASFAPDVAGARGDAAAMAIMSVAAEMLATAARAAGDGPVAFVGGLSGVDELREHLELAPVRGDALDGALRLTAIHEPHVIRVPAGEAGRDAAPRGDAAHDGGVAADVDRLETEAVRPGLDDLDARPIADVVGLLVAAEGEAHRAIVAAVPQVAAAAEAIAERLERGGRLIYAGAGTAGRLGVLDAAECGPTFGTDLVRAVIAGGDAAVTEAVEGAEDAFDPAALADVSANDAVVGISASGRTPYVIGALEHARGAGALTVALVNNPRGRARADIVIEVLTGPEVLAGSTRLTAGTAQKVVLNALSTAVMIRLGKVYGARMVDLRATNAKLRRRAIRIVRDAAGVDEAAAEAALQAADGHAKTAIVALLAGVDAREAAARLERAGGKVRVALCG
jgi:N-acetylmuramic acid 6-phosphate etherase